jgi:hypothetical protein
MSAVCSLPKNMARPSTPTHVGAVARPLAGAAAAKYVDIYMEAINGITPQGCTRSIASRRRRGEQVKEIGQDVQELEHAHAHTT